MNNDVLYEIMLHMKIIDLYHFSLTSHYYFQLSHNHYFWECKNKLDQTTFNLKNVIKTCRDIMVASRDCIYILIPEQYNKKLLTYNLFSDIISNDGCYVNINIYTHLKLLHYLAYDRYLHFEKNRKTYYMSNHVLFKLLISCVYDMNLIYKVNYGSVTMSDQNYFN